MEFFTSGQILIVIIGFFVMVVLYYYTINFIIKIIAIGFHVLINKFVKPDYDYYFFMSNFAHKAYIQDKKTFKIYKGKGFKGFQKYIEIMQKGEILKTMEFINSFLICTLICYYGYGLNHIFHWFITLIITSYCLFYPLNLFVNYIIHFNIDKYEDVLLNTKVELINDIKIKN